MDQASKVAEERKKRKNKKKQKTKNGKISFYQSALKKENEISFSLNVGALRDSMFFARSVLRANRNRKINSKQINFYGTLKCLFSMEKRSGRPALMWAGRKRKLCGDNFNFQEFMQRKLISYFWNGFF